MLCATEQPTERQRFKKWKTKKQRQRFSPSSRNKKSKNPRQSTLLFEEHKNHHKEKRVHPPRLALKWFAPPVHYTSLKKEKLQQIFWVFYRMIRNYWGNATINVRKTEMSHSHQASLSTGLKTLNTWDWPETIPLYSSFKKRSSLFENCVKMKSRKRCARQLFF